MILIATRFSPQDLQSVRDLLDKLKSLLPTGDCVIERNYKNMMFDKKYPLRDKEKFDILKELTIDDFVKREENTNSRYSAAELFFFMKDIELSSYGELEQVRIYIKLYIDEKPNYDVAIVISFHEEGMFD